MMAQSPVVLPDGTSLYVQKHEVTVAEWNVCHVAGACTLALRAAGNRSAATTPATGLSFDDVDQYVSWINAVTGHTYRLPTLQEWKFMADEVLPETPDPIFTDPDLTWASAYVSGESRLELSA
jgi:formylglycine-generating enzyme required for sulfatase activity